MSAPELLHTPLLSQARTRPEATALIDRDASLSYAELGERVLACAAGLQRLGLAAGERVAIYLEKRVETVLASFGCAAAGGVLVPVNPVLKPRQVAHILADSEARFLVTSPQRLATLAEELATAGGPERVVLVGEPPAGDGDGRSLHGWEELEGSGEPADPGLGEDSLAAILYTSGSTGKPKGVVLSHANLAIGARSVNEYLGNGPEDCLLAALPLSFDAGFSQLTTGFAAGSRVVLHNYLLPGDVVRACAEHGVTGLTCVPPLWMQIAEREWPPSASAGLRYFANTGGRMPASLLGRLRETFPGATPFLMYGLTEAFRSTYLDPAEVDRRPDSIGKAIPNAEVLVVGPEGQLRGPGEEGELVHCGPLVAQGYWRDPERSAERFRPAPAGARYGGDAVYSGDIVSADEEGFLYFVGRDDEMIKTSGYRVSPTEVEEAAYASGLVGDAVALGLADERLGQRVVLAVSPAGDTLDEAELLRALGKELPRFMLPGEIEVRGELPRSPNGKFDRTALRRELEAR